ncbi:MAG: hypothetical protein FWF29_05985, partial [Treponema sp.]|nr:hypothetical protein [Treponema sp.]
IAAYEGIGDYGVPSGLTVVEALKEGDALVTIQSVNDPSVQGTMQITVHPAPVPPASATHKKSADLPLGGSLPGTWLPDAFGESVADAVNACGGDTVYVVFNLNGDGYNTGDTVATFGFGRAVFSITYPLKKTDDGRTALTGTQIMAVLNDDSLKLPAGALTTQIENCDKIISAELWIPN